MKTKTDLQPVDEWEVFPLMVRVTKLMIAERDPERKIELGEALSSLFRHGHLRAVENSKASPQEKAMERHIFEAKEQAAAERERARYWAKVHAGKKG